MIISIPVDYYTHKTRWDNIKDEARNRPDLFKRDAHQYLMELAPIIEIGIEALKPKPIPKPVVAKKAPIKPAPKKKKR